MFLQFDSNIDQRLDTNLTQVYTLYMLKQKFELTKVILKNLSEIERLYGQLESKRAPQSLLLNLERENLVQSSYSSNSIEGNPLSHAEVTNLLLDSRVPTNRDEKEVANYFQILKTLESLISSDVNTGLILDIHKQLMMGVSNEIGGTIRNTSVIVGGYGLGNQLIIKHNPPAHDREGIVKLLEELYLWLKSNDDSPILKAGIFHHQFVHIHPFIDGNGRTCRLLTALIFLQNKYQINKYFVLDDYYNIDKDQYSDKLHSADGGELTQWLEYFTDGVKYSLQSALAKIDTGLAKLTFDIRPSKKENEVLNIFQTRHELSSSDLALELKITRQQAFNYLKSLLNKGFIERKGVGKSSYYVLK